MREVVLVDLNDTALGKAEKLKAHENGWLHRAFSVFLYHDNQLLLHRRAKDKYHCGGLWTNTCCSHPNWDESILDAARRRLQEEMGIVTEDLEEIQSFVYRYPFDNGLIEYEYDHIVIGEYQGEFTPNPEEVDCVKWVPIEELKDDILHNPHKYTPWFLIAFCEVVRSVNDKNSKR